jgi:hypothetical protein
MIDVLRSRAFNSAFDRKRDAHAKADAPPAIKIAVGKNPAFFAVCHFP